jgi:PAS domain S-box-containing protein
MTQAKILVVEDEPAVGKIIRRSLEGAGFTVTGVASTGKQAIDAAKLDAPDLVLMDTLLPGEMDGVEAARRIRFEINIPVVFLTAFADERTLERAKAAEPLGYLPKPFDRRELQTTLENALHQFRMSDTKAQQDPHQVEEKYRAIFENLPVGIYRTTPDGRILDANTALIEILGYPDRQSLLTANIHDIFVQPEDRQRWRAMFEHDKIVRDFKTRLRRYDGTTILVLDNARGIPAADGQIQYYEGSLLDITEREQTKQELSLERELTNALMEHTPDHVYFKDTKSRFLRVSRAMAEWFGLDEPAAAIGKTDFDFFDLKHAEPARADELKIMETGEPLVGIEEREVWPDGRVTWVSTTKVPLRDRNGRIIGTFGTSRDITERKQAEAALRLAQFTLDHAGDAVFWLGPDAAFTYFNDAACEMLGYSREELLRMTVHDINPGHPKEVWPAHWAELQQRKSLTFEANLRTKDGRLVAVELTANHLEFEGREFHCSFARDITERKRAEQERLALSEQLRQSQKMEAIGRLAGGIAHDFNNLLTIITGYSELPIANLGQDDPLREVLENIKRAATQAADLTRQLLAFSRRQVFEMKVCDLNTIIGNLEKMLCRILGEDVELCALLAEDLGKVKIDPGQIEQVILNLVVNARDAMPSGGKLTIETTNADLSDVYTETHVGVTPGRYVMLSISDTGIGMTPEVKARIFEPFFTTKEKDVGTGLGLSTVYGIIKQSEGNIWVYSEPGQGTTFKIYLPRVEELPEDEERKLETEKPAHGSETILIAEDEERVRRLVVEMLRKQGYEVLDAGSGDEALQISKNHEGTIHLALTDVVMPGMDGRELVERLIYFHPHMKVLYMSGYTDNAVIRHGILRHHVNYIQKPFTLYALLHKVRQLLDESATK